MIKSRLAVRSGLTSGNKRVLFPDSRYGISCNDITIAEQLKKVNYNTACIGKWDLGHQKKYLPLQHGFDYYFGIPYSNDMDVPS